MSSGGYERNDERVSNVLSQATIDKALKDHEMAQNARQGAPTNNQQASSYSQGPDRPGIARKDTTSRRDPLTGDLIEEYSGDGEGPAMRAHYNWDEPGKAPSNMPQSQQVQGQGQRGPTGSSQEPRPGQVHRTNTTISYNSSGDRVEEHDGEGSLRVRALYNDDEDPSTTYRPAPQRHQSERGQDHRY
ncbi:uncharacterized protein LAJ45_01817 [Morchella importuna]|uniref:Uncharacterized protein n=1 Tax=Morchella conica CCBAS932 TaxID=1392247 RepID=A0A3N4LFR1_9PEZI|nr:uncharacterized protein LAJ45_01817 [Morchella importuna]KAH8154050.1 hypothetical protein LAJ45_01817 [Morchella importuna]RPB16775.1 hypothetical protein P167DRAFT_192335 [Morchella conica CCBAS932]